MNAKINSAPVKIYLQQFIV